MRRLLAIGLVVALFVLSSCAPASGTFPTIAATAASVGRAAAGSGIAHFHDKLATLDQFALKMDGAAMPLSGQAYQGWLVGDDGTTISVGIIRLGPDGSVTFEWNSPNSENLLNRFSRFQITVEPAAGSAKPTGKVIFYGGLEGKALANARQAFVRTAGQAAALSSGGEYGGPPVSTPLNTALAPGLKAQAGVAVQHIQNAVNADAIGSRAEMHVHLEHVVNILEGTTGLRFGDHDGNGKAENPGDGFGVFNYLKGIGELYGEQASVVTASKEVQSQMTAIEDKCLEILKLKNDASATAQLKELLTLANQFQAGPVAKLYEAAQEALSFPVSPAR